MAVDIFRQEKIYPGWWPTQAQHFAVIGAMHALAREFPERFVLTGGKGRLPLWLNVRSRMNVDDEDARF